MKSLHGLPLAVALGLALPLPAANYTAGTVAIGAFETAEVRPGCLVIVR